MSGKAADDLVLDQDFDQPFGGPHDTGRKSQWSTVPGAAPRVPAPDPGTAPWDGVVLVNTLIDRQAVQVGTGFLIAPDVILTARHNFDVIWNGLALWMGYDAQMRPAPPRPHVCALPLKHETLDLAVVLVEPRPETVFQLGETDGSSVTLAGYGYSWNGSPLYRQASGAVLTTVGADLRYRINTQEADSGAPVFMVDGGAPRAAAIHLSGAAAGQAGNRGLRFTPPVLKEVRTLVQSVRASIR
ncbi:trypsin-like serine peptidase [Brevundimonas sp.]|uniref:trypsin-like serine peptidase n=1 Tax=Brevundimonas sp. TaxID=1871086 RepID=UPI0037C0BC3E